MKKTTSGYDEYRSKIRHLKSSPFFILRHSDFVIKKTNQTDFMPSPLPKKQSFLNCSFAQFSGVAIMAPLTALQPNAFPHQHP